MDWKVQLHPKHNQVGKKIHTKYIINKKTCKKCLIEVLACPCKHLGVIKHLIIHLETMEAYTLWWNGGTVQKLLDYNTKYWPIMDNWMLLWEGGRNMEGQTWLVTFKQNYVKMTWPSMNIMRWCQFFTCKFLTHVAWIWWTLHKFNRFFWGMPKTPWSKVVLHRELRSHELW